MSALVRAVGSLPGLAGVVAVAGFGALYLALTHERWLPAATHAFTVVCAAFTVTAAVAAASAWGARAASPNAPG